MVTLNLSKLIRIVEDLLKQNEKLVEALELIERAYPLNGEAHQDYARKVLTANAAMLERIAGDEK